MASNKTVDKTLKILELIASNSDGLTLSEIYKTLELPKATVYDILQSLYREDAVYYKDPNLKNYVIGSKIFAISQAYTKNSNFINFSKNKLKEFADKYSLTVFANKRLEQKCLSIYKYESAKTKITTSDIGIGKPLYSDPAGKVFLTFLSEPKRTDLLNSFKNISLNSLNDKYEDLLDELNNIRNYGYVLDNGVTVSYMCTFAVPVYNFESKCTGVLSASRLIDNESDNQIKQQIKELLDIAEYVSLKQGYKGDFYEKHKL